MFNGLAFDQDLGDWRSKRTNMGGIFSSASAFDQDLGWCVDDDVDLDYAFDDTLCESTIGRDVGANTGDCDVPPRVTSW